MQQFIGNRIVGSIGSLLIGVLVFIGSFVLLYVGEMRTDYSDIAKKAASISSAKEGDFVYLTGEIKSQKPLGDGLYLKESDYIAVERIVEMYAWTEDSDTTSNDMTIYNYTQEWTQDPQNSSSFDTEFGHENPSMVNKSERFHTDKAMIGEYIVDMDKVRLPSYEELKIDQNKVRLGNYETLDTLDGKTYIYDGYGTLAEPETGSIRISYNIIPSGKKMTVFGKVEGKEFSYHSGEKEKELYRMFYGTKDDALGELKGEYSMWGWIYKILGFIIMWIGLSMILSPLTTVLEVVPIIGGMGKSALGILTFIVAVLLTLLTSFILSVLHSPVGLIMIVLIVFAIGYFVNNMKQSKPSTSTSEQSNLPK
jgi:hypothetical protein